MIVIYPSPIFGPIHSRRLGISLGINLMPSDGKLCSFDCIYCECGFNKDFRPYLSRPTKYEVYEALEKKLLKMKEEGINPDVLTFAGNGEPTLHPDFSHIIDDTLFLRDKYFPKAKVSVLSNSTAIFKDSVFESLKKVDNNILKLDTVDSEYIKRLDRPVGDFCVEKIVDKLVEFNGKCIIQTIFLKGISAGYDMNNTTDKYVLPWLEALKIINPSQVMIYTIDRETPDKSLIKATHEELENIAEKIKSAGFSVSVSY